MTPSTLSLIERLATLHNETHLQFIEMILAMNSSSVGDNISFPLLKHNNEIDASLQAHQPMLEVSPVPIQAPAPVPIQAPALVPIQAPAPVPIQAPAPVPIQAPVEEKGGTSDSKDPEVVVMEAIALFTGYEVDMIEEDMDLETDLGIDSIKRVEILSEVQNRLGVTITDISSLAETRTVLDVMEFMKHTAEKQQSL